MSTFTGGKRLLPQKVFDGMVVEVKDSTPGMTLAEAVVEAGAVFEEDYSLEGLWVYGDENEMAAKVKVEANLTVVERTAANEETAVNCRFAFQGLSQALNATGRLQKGAWRLVEARKLVHSLVALLQVREGEGEGGARDDGEDDDDEEDEDEDRALFLCAVLDLILFLANGAPSHFLNAEGAFTLPPESLIFLTSRLDESMSEKRVASKLVDVLAVLLSQTSNRAAFAETGVPLLGTVAKFFSKDAGLKSKIDHILTHFR